MEKKIEVKEIEFIPPEDEEDNESPRPDLDELPKYLWRNPIEVRHNIRVIGDEESLNWEQKNLLCDICRCESDFNPNAKRVNTPNSVDRGLFQWNSKYWSNITDEMAFNPEICTRLACREIFANRNHWTASQKCWNKKYKYNFFATEGF